MSQCQRDGVEKKGASLQCQSTEDTIPIEFILQFRYGGKRFCFEAVCCTQYILLIKMVKRWK